LLLPLGALLAANALVEPEPELLLEMREEREKEARKIQ
jgi:hypothetical protein